MASAYKCDMCGNFFVYDPNRIVFPPMNIRRQNRETEEIKNYDICDFCADHIETLIKMGKVRTGK